MSLSEMEIAMKTHQIWWIATKVGAYHEKMGKSKRSNIATDILVMIWVISFFCIYHLISHVQFLCGQNSIQDIFHFPWILLFQNELSLKTYFGEREEKFSNISLD